MNPATRTDPARTSNMNYTLITPIQNKEAADQTDTTTIQIDELTRAPGRNHLTLAGRVRAGLLYSARAGGAAMFSTGVTSEICRHMMDNPNRKASTGLLISFGAGLYVAGLVVGYATRQNYAARWDSIQQSLCDAVVPSIVAFSVYLALSHGDI